MAFSHSSSSPLLISSPPSEFPSPPPSPPSFSPLCSAIAAISPSSVSFSCASCFMNSRSAYAGCRPVSLMYDSVHHRFEGFHLGIMIPRHSKGPVPIARLSQTFQRSSHKSGHFTDSNKKQWRHVSCTSALARCATRRSASSLHFDWVKVTTRKLAYRQHATRSECEH